MRRSPSPLQIGGIPALRQPTPLPEAEPVTAAFPSLVEDLERVQAFSQMVFPLPKELTRDDRAAIGRAARLVAGERVAVARGPASLTITLADPQFLEKLVIENTPLSFGFEEGNYVETIAGVEVPLGPGFVTLASATVANRDELLATRSWHTNQQLPVTLQPTPGVQLEILLTRNTESAA